MPFCVHAWEYLLMPKSFVIETDHRNLLWLESSLIPKVIRWRVYLHGFDFQIRHIPGTSNSIADWLSRLHTDCHATLNVVAAPLTPLECFASVHGGRMGHHGVARTMQLLSRHCPGHGLSQSQVSDLILECPQCQKVRANVNFPSVSMHRTLSQPHLRSAIGCDTLSVSPPDKAGNRYIVVIVNLFSKYVALYPVPTHNHTEEELSVVY
jgi:hypothetical protein